MLAASPTTVVKSIAALSRAPSPELQRNVLATIAELEEQAATETPLSPQGRWSLLFSTQVALPDSAAERPSSMAIVQPLIDATYGLFFKVAPQLAGAQQYGGTSLGSNEQIVSIEGASGKVENRVRVPLPRWMGSAPSRLEIRLFGDVSTTEAEDTLSVTFTECIFQVGGGDDPRPLRARVPLPRPVGTLRTTYCDDGLRISRGGRGGVFVLKRLKQEQTTGQVGADSEDRNLFFGPSSSSAASSSSAGAARPLGTTDPIAGPLVAAARRLGVLPEEEEDGWTGEPSAWADAESVPQRLSELTQRYLGGFKQFVAEQVAGDFDVDAADGQLDDVIGSAPVAIFSFTSCPFCKQAKELLDAKGVAYRAFELDEDALGAGMRARLGKRTGRTSVPSIWIGGECVGGLNDGNPGLVPLEERGELDAKLRAAGVLR